MSSTKENILLFPFMGQGHMIPFLTLALNLEQEKGYAITLVNTPNNILKLQSYLPPNSSIRLLEIPFDSENHGLPLNNESMDTLPPDLILKFIESSRSLKPAFEKLISDLVHEQTSSSLTCIISDWMLSWSVEVAHKFGIFHAIFNVIGAYGMAGYHTMWLNLPHLKQNAPEFPLPNFPKGYSFLFDQLPPLIKSATAIWEFVQNTFHEWSETDAMLFNTVEDIDQIGLTYFREQYSWPIFSVGLIISPPGSRTRRAKEAETNSKICKQWLDSKPANSVLYVAFGSQNTPSARQSKQLAEALEASGVNFIWAARPPSGFATESNSNDDVDKTWLPEGFEDRIHRSNKGLLIFQWAPQVDILSHESVGGFLSHCGWNSIIEALSNGIPILSWPMAAEQPFNAKYLEEELGVGIGFANGKQCELQPEEAAEKIKVVMIEALGEKMRSNASKIKVVIEKAWNGCDGHTAPSDAALDDFLSFAMQRKEA
ncbi:OLC1v1005816C1 [Oldenlandia corymbosa var. corymbosa]|uniref:Glycosyltransferase n=1 Tax=Oldenlandia corymbosa var. corymbosa TaxID=529605 RepID=A0AAV1DHV3_OLDCO|nr:OLC1v1005816C1 [Oldenlandia corymbosa var. corymbosa]